MQAQEPAAFARNDRDLKGVRSVWYSIPPDGGEPERLLRYPSGFVSADGANVLPGGQVFPCQGFFYQRRDRRPTSGGWLVRFLRWLHAV